MTGVPAERAAEIPDGRPAVWPPLVGLLLPLALILGSAILVPPAAGQLLGISLTSWCLFACAPATSLCLVLCYRFGGAAGDREDTEQGEAPR